MRHLGVPAIILYCTLCSPLDAQVQPPPVGEGICVMNCGSTPAGPDPVSPATAYRMQRYRVAKTLKDKIQDAGDDSLLSEHLERIAARLPDERQGQSLADVWYASDELANYFDGYLYVYQEQEKELQEIGKKIEALKASRHEMLARLKAWGLSSDGKGDADAFRVLSAEAHALGQTLGSIQRRLDAEFYFNNRISRERGVVARRVLERIGAPIPEWYTANYNYSVSIGLYGDEASRCLSAVPPLPHLYLSADDRYQAECVKYLNNCALQFWPSPSYPKPVLNHFSNPHPTASDIQAKLRKADPSVLIAYLEDEYLNGADEDPMESGSRRLNQEWQSTAAVGDRYRRFDHLYNIQIGPAKEKIRTAKDLMAREKHAEAFDLIVGDAFWWFLDHLTQTLLKRAGSNDPEAISQLRRVEDDAVKFSGGTFQITREAVNALVSGNPAEIQNLENLMQEKLCDFRTDVDKELSPSQGDRFLFPQTLTCQ